MSIADISGSNTKLLLGLGMIMVHIWQTVLLKQLDTQATDRGLQQLPLFLLVSCYGVLSYI